MCGEIDYSEVYDTSRTTRPLDDAEREALDELANDIGWLISGRTQSSEHLPDPSSDEPRPICKEASEEQAVPAAEIPPSHRDWCSRCIRAFRTQNQVIEGVFRNWDPVEQGWEVCR